MAEVELRLLGPVRALVDGHDVDIGGPRSRAVLATLGLARSGLTVERIVDGVWGAQPPDSAVRTARSYLSRLRSALGSETVVSVRGRYALDQRVSVDVDSFERDLGVEGDAAQQILALRHALALWDGDAPLVGGEPAERGAVEHLLDRRREARHRLALLLWQTGATTEALDASRSALDADPLDEAVRAALARGLSALGRQGEALAVIADGVHLLREELGLDPSPVLRRAQQDVLSQRVPPAVPELLPIPLPSAVSSFVGRQRELAELRGLLAEHRLVTVVALGGCGKTRLALELAREAEADGRIVVLASLAAADGRTTVDILRQACGLPASTVEDRDLVVAAVGARDVLLVIDNAEESPEGTADLVVALLQRCPALRVLVTSRVPLAVAGEHVQHLAPLSLSGDRPEAVQLFLTRAGAASGGRVDLDPASVDAVCRALDGVPLAIELAAARLGVVDLETLCSDLQEQLRRAERRGGETRHRSMSAVLAGTIDGLDAPARELFLRLATYRGPFTAREVAAVCDEHAAHDLVPLVEAGLVQRGGGELRMFGPVRQYAAWQVQQQGRAEQLAALHAAAVHSLLADRAASDPSWLRSASRRADDLLAALDHARSSSEWDLLVDLTLDGAALWRRRGPYDEGLARCLAVLDGVADIDPGRRLDLVLEVGVLSRYTGDIADGLRRIDDVQTIVEPGSRRQGLLLQMRGLLLGAVGDGDAARDSLSRARDILEALPDAAVQAALAAGSLADSLRADGRYEEAEALLLDGLEVMRRERSVFGQEAFLESLAGVAFATGRLDEAADLCGQAEVFAEHLEEPLHRALIALLRARIARRLGGVAAGHVRDAMRWSQVCGDAWTSLDAVAVSAGLLVDIGRYDDAALLLEAVAAQRSSSRRRTELHSARREAQDLALARAGASRPVRARIADVPSLVRAAAQALDAADL